MGEAMRRWRLGALTLSAAILCASAVRARAEEEAPPGKDGAALEEVRALKAELRRRQEKIDRMHKIVLTQQVALEVAKKNMRNAVKQRMEMENDRNKSRAETVKLRDEKARLEKELHGFRRLLAGHEEPRRAEQPQGHIHCKVLAVRPDINLVVLSVGRDDQVKRGHRFYVYRGETYVAKVEVEKAFAETCSARILPGWLKEPIREGDDAATGFGEAAPPGPREERPGERRPGDEKPGAGGPPGEERPGEIRCKIIAVRPEVNLVMLSVGSDDGVKPGYRFTVYRGGGYAGKVEVEKVFTDMSSARILTKWPIREGDDASTGLGEAAPRKPRGEERGDEGPGAGDDEPVF